ncbi:UNVERIFIED_CONTAM: hypothetical protein HDU68_009861 [Siphonaria sp. JEL0065]|nr:hypothetical protein HDU68_009861 [Siphonaria sp. JEL0065]
MTAVFQQQQPRSFSEHTQQAQSFLPQSPRSFSGASEQAQREELRLLQEEQSKLSYLLAEIQKMPLPRRESVSVSLRSPPHPRGSSDEDAVSIKSVGTTFTSGGGSLVYPDESWSVIMVAEWVKQKGATDDIVRAFVDQDIDGGVLMSLSGEDLKNELGVLSFGLRRKILLAIEKSKA